MSQALVVRNVRLVDGREVDIRLTGGRISDVVDAGTQGLDGAEVDGGGGLCVRPLTDAHLHLDKAGTVGALAEPPATIAAAIEAMRAVKETERADPNRLDARMARIVDLLHAHGTRAMRAVVDVDETWGLAAFDAATKVRAEVADRLHISLVAFPQEGLTPAVADLMREAVSRGADVIGAHTDIDTDHRAHLATAADIARETGKPLEVHADEAASPDSFKLPDVLESADGTSHLTLVHCLSLGTLNHEDQVRWVDRIRERDADVVVAPSVLSFGLPLAPLDLLADAGVHLHIGSDNLQDVFVPHGTGDLLAAARTAAMVQGVAGRRVIDALVTGVTNTAYSLVTGTEAQITVGSPATFTVFTGSTTTDVFYGSDQIVLDVHDGRRSDRRRSA